MYFTVLDPTGDAYDAPQNP